MAAIDSLLKIIETRLATGLSVRSDEVPLLLTGEKQIPLTMPPIPAALMESFLSDIVGSDGLEQLAQGDPLKGDYTSGNGDEFSYSIQKVENGIQIDFMQSSPAGIEIVDPVDKPIVPSGPSLEVATGLCSRSPEAVPISHQILQVIDEGLGREASDLFFSSGKAPHYRVNGKLISTSAAVVSEDQVLALANLTGSVGRQDDFAARMQVDCALTLQIAGRSQRFRLNLFKHHRGVAVTLRPIRKRIPTFKDLNLPREMVKLGEYSNGLVLVTGSAGSGKSTTLAAIVEHVNQTTARHIITLEAPIEFEYESKCSMIHQREVGEDVVSFSEGLRAALRESPDIILLGEMRDLDTIQAALTAAETGHLVLSTLHTRDASSTVERIIDVFPSDQQNQIRIQLANSLRAVFSQQLIPDARDRGRVPIFERLFVTSAVAHLIRDSKDHQIRSQIQTGGAADMITFERSLVQLVRSGKITESVAMNYAPDVSSLRKLLRD